MSLESLRNVRAQVEQAITMELARITGQLVQMEEQSRALTQQIESDADTYRVHTEQGLTIEYVLEWQARMDARQAALTQTNRAIATLTEAWHHTQARLIEASQEKKVVERLAERRQQAHRRELERRDQLVTDEAASRQQRTIGRPA